MMRNNILNKLRFTLLMLLGVFVSGQGMPPPPPPQEETGGIGTPMDTPVDMYVIFLTIIAIMFIVYFVRQYNNKKIA